MPGGIVTATGTAFITGVFDMDMFVIIRAVIETLNEVEIKGSDNMSKLLGCINALTEIINQPKDGEEVNNG